MASANRCFFIGNATKDCEIKYTANGDAIANLSIAVNESYKDKSGQKVEKTEFVNIVAYRKLAEIMGEYCRKGQSVFISGKMQTRKWQTKEGQDRYSTEIIADEMQLLGGKAQSDNTSRDDGTMQRQDSKPNDKDDGFEDTDSVPF